MSWGVGAVGKAGPVATEIERQFAGMPAHQEPEESIRQAARSVIAAALKGQARSTVVKVAACGSQSQKYEGGKATGEYTNNLTISVEPQSGFVEEPVAVGHQG
jgi:hypothetical protein